MLRKLSPILLKSSKSVLGPQTYAFQVLRNVNNYKVAQRSFSSEAPKSSGEPAAAVDPSTPGAYKSSAVQKVDFDDEDYYEPQTKQEKVWFYGSVFMRLALMLTGLGLAGYTIYFLFPSRMSPNNVFSAVFDKLEHNDVVREVTGDGMKAFGRDTGRNTEGRRNHIDSYEYKAADGSKRTRVRFNIKGNKGQLHVWAEVADSMQDGEYVYVICQNARTGRVLTVIDDRESVDAGMIAPREDGWFTEMYKKLTGATTN